VDMFFQRLMVEPCLMVECSGLFRRASSSFDCKLDAERIEKKLTDHIEKQRTDCIERQADCSLMATDCSLRPAD